MKPKATIMFSGMIAADPWHGGATWAVLQYILGLRRLGYQVYLVESMPSSAVRPAGCALPESENASYFGAVMKQFDFTAQSSLLLAGTRETIGLPYDELQRVARTADLLINISGMLTDEALVAKIPIRVYLDLDPAFNQLWQAVQGIDMRFGGHTHFVTIGQAIGQPDCQVPTCGLRWLTTRQPIVLDYWPRVEDMAYAALTTVANWRGYGSIEHQGVLYGQKAHSLRQFFPLPTLTTEQFILALGIHPGETKDLAALAANRWQLLDPAKVTNTPNSYRQFIQQSKAEFGIAKSGYALSRCGWFSDRSVCYLASGRPVIAQQTGFDRFLPTGEGLFAFETMDDVLHSIEAMRADYARHARRARAIAEDYFDSDKVLTACLEKLGV